MKSIFIKRQFLKCPKITYETVTLLSNLVITGNPNSIDINSGFQSLIRMDFSSILKFEFEEVKNAQIHSHRCVLTLKCLYVLVEFANFFIEVKVYFNSKLNFTPKFKFPNDLFKLIASISSTSSSQTVLNAFIHRGSLIYSIIFFSITLFRRFLYVWFLFPISIAYQT